MTIDEAIKKCEYGIKFSDEEHEELRIMLEDLKTYINAKNMSDGYILGHNKAIDEQLRTGDENKRDNKAYLTALEDYHRLISEECKLMLTHDCTDPSLFHLKNYNNEVLERLKAGGNS